jgi:hypothetical protein
MNYNVEIEYECNCTNISLSTHNSLMRRSVKADKNKVNELVRKQLPNLYKELALEFYNPYDYGRTDTHLILVHSMIEYFLKIK